MTPPVPSAINLHKRSRELELAYSDGQRFKLSCELLRVLSPSAEVQGHGNPVLQTGKKYVVITGIEAVGNYAIKLTFDDGHNSGLFSWDYLHDLCINQESHWEDYLRQLHAAGASRDPEVSVVKLM